MSGHFNIMNILAAVFFLITIATAIIAGRRQNRIDSLERELRNVKMGHIEQDGALDFVLRQYELHVDNPYVDRPSVVSIKNGRTVIDQTEKSCFHCLTPIGHPHNPECVWLRLRPLTKRLYHSV